MVDTRFHFAAGPAPLAALLEAVGGPVVSDPRIAALVISGADELATAGPGHVALAAQLEYATALKVTEAGAVIVSERLLADVPSSSVAIPARDPHKLFADLLDRLYPGDTRGVIAAFLAPRDT